MFPFKYNGDLDLLIEEIEQILNASIVASKEGGVGRRRNSFYFLSKIEEDLRSLLGVQAERESLDRRSNLHLAICR